MKKSIVIFCYALLLMGRSFAQEAPTMLAIYEEHVMPSKDAQYNDGVKKLKAMCEQNKTDVTWTSFKLDDNSYVHSVPIKSFADLDKNAFASLESKIGKEALGSIWSNMDQCVESSKSYVLLRMPNHSYLTTGPDDIFRDITYWFVQSDKTAEAEKIIMEWKQLNESKKTPNGFLALKVVFGSERGYIILGWGKTLLDWATKDQKNNELLGEEGGKLWAKTMAITKQYYSRKGWRQPNLSYSPPPVAGTK